MKINATEPLLRADERKNYGESIFPEGLRYATFTALIMAISLIANSQNLVPNPSFENVKIAPCSWTLNNYDFTKAIENWIMPTMGSTDIFTTLVDRNCYAHCLSTSEDANGNQLPRTGKVMSAIVTYGYGCGTHVLDTSIEYREYLEIQLIQPLVVGLTYYAELYVSLADSARHASNNIGMYFSDTLIHNRRICSELDFRPQINENSIITDNKTWVEVSGEFIATSPARYLVIGNFSNNNMTSNLEYHSKKNRNAMYYIDDVLVKQACLVVSPDTTICQNDTLNLHAQSNSLIGWASSTQPNKIISTGSTLSVSPQHTTTYLAYSSCDTASVTVRVNHLPSFTFGSDTTLCLSETMFLDATSLGAKYLWQDSTTNSTYNITQQGVFHVDVSNICGLVSDTLEVSYDSCNCELFIPNAFTPNGDYINPRFSPVSNCALSDYNLVIFNRWGEKVYETNYLDNSWDGMYQGKLSPNGVYVYFISYQGKGKIRTIKNGTVTLIR